MYFTIIQSLYYLNKFLLLLSLIFISNISIVIYDTHPVNSSRIFSKFLKARNNLKKFEMKICKNMQNECKNITMFIKRKEKIK